MPHNFMTYAKTSTQRGAANDTECSQRESCSLTKKIEDDNIVCVGAAGTLHLLRNANHSRRSVLALPFRRYSVLAAPPGIYIATTSASPGLTCTLFMPVTSVGKGVVLASADVSA